MIWVVHKFHDQCSFDRQMQGVSFETDGRMAAWRRSHVKTEAETRGMSPQPKGTRGPRDWKRQARVFP